MRTATRATLAISGGTPVRTRLLPYGRQTVDDTDVRAVVETSSAPASPAQATERDRWLARRLGELRTSLAPGRDEAAGLDLETIREDLHAWSGRMQAGPIPPVLDAGCGEPERVSA